MSIRNTQIKKAIDKIVKNHLKSNVSPTKEALAGDMYEYFNANEPGLPTFKGLSVNKKTVTSSEEYYKALDEIEWDLEVLFEDLLQKNEKLINRQISQDVKRKKIIKKIDEIKAELEETKEVMQEYNENIILDEYAFTDYNKYTDDSTAFLDLKYDNLKLKPLLYKTSTRFIENITLDDYSPQGRMNTEEVAGLENARNDYENDSWILKVEPEDGLEEDIEQASVSLLVKLANETFINQIELISNAAEEEIVDIQLSQDKKEWINIFNATGRQTLKERLMYYFEPIKAKYAYITIAKNFTEIDDRDIYIFSLRNISFYDMKYDNNNYIESNVRRLPSRHTIDKIKLEADEYVPDGTSANYYINIYQEDGEKDQYSVVPSNRQAAADENKIINLINTSEYSVELQNNIEKHHIEELDRHNKRFYRINEEFERLSDDIIDTEVSLFKGIEQWEKQAYQHYRPDDHRISIDDWTNKPVSEDKVVSNYHNVVGGAMQHLIRQFIDYEPDKYYYPLKFRYVMDPEDILVKRVVGNTEVIMEDYSIDKTLCSDIAETDRVLAVTDIQADRDDIIFIEYPARFMNYKFTRYFYCNEPQSFTTKQINLPSQIYDEMFEKDAIYLNNRRLPRIQDVQGHYFRGHTSEGWNRIDYLCYINSPQNLVIDGDNSQGFLTKNFMNFKKEVEVLGDDSAEHVVTVDRSRARKDTLNYTDVYTLRNKTPQNKTDKFGLHKASGGYDVIVNTPALANYKVVHKNITDHYNRYSLGVELNTEDHNFTPEVENVDVKFTY